MMKYFEGIEDRELIKQCRRGDFPTDAVIIELGNRLLEKGGRDLWIVTFLRSFLVNEKTSFEIWENCFAFLEASRERLFSGTVAVLDNFKKEPRYAELIRRAGQKIRASRMKEVLDRASVRITAQYAQSSTPAP